MSDAQQHPLTEAKSRHFVLTTVWQGLTELADQINTETDRIATLALDPTAEPGGISLCVYPVGSQPAQATPLFRYDVAVSSVASGVRVQFQVQPAVVNGQMRGREQGELVSTAQRERRPRTPQDIRHDVARRYQAVVEAPTPGVVRPPDQIKRTTPGPLSGPAHQVGPLILADPAAQRTGEQRQ